MIDQQYQHPDDAQPEAPFDPSVAFKEFSGAMTTLFQAWISNKDDREDKYFLLAVYEAANTANDTALVAAVRGRLLLAVSADVEDVEE